MKLISSNLFVYGTAHAVVDAVCAGILFTILSQQIVSETMVAYLFVAYNLLAFGLQVILGFIIDYLKAPRSAAVLGIVITAISALVFVPLPVVAVVLCGIGNALFHVGGGTISLNLTHGKAVAPGIFVAPGAFGLMIGTILGKSGNFIAWPFLLIMVFLSAAIFIIKKPEISYHQRKETLIVQSGSVSKELRSPRPWLRREPSLPGLAMTKENILSTRIEQNQETTPGREFKFEYIIFLVLFVIAIRSLVGVALVFPWRSDLTLLIMLTLSIVLGKGLGGFLAHRFGWTLIAVGSLIVSIPLLTLGANIPVLAMLGMFLFNVTMPVTLTMVSNLLPGLPGSAFGLTCVAYILGVLPAFSEFGSTLNSPVFIFTVISISTVALYFGLQFYFMFRKRSRQETLRLLQVERNAR